MSENVFDPKENANNAVETDLFRDTKVRYLGYANEVGEAFRALIPRNWVRASYAVAIGYVLADTVHKSNQSYEVEPKLRKMMIAATDALIWQTLASVVIPGFTINRICAFSHKTLKKKISASGSTKKMMTVGIGLACIPLIIHPIDISVSYMMDCTYRKWIAEQ